MDASDGYPDSVEGVALHKAGNESGYKGVTAVRIPMPGFRARDGPRTLGTFPDRVQAALAFARSQLEHREEKHHVRKEDRRRGTKRKKGACENAKPEQAAGSSHIAASFHYGAAEARRYTNRNEKIQDELASRCLTLLLTGGSCSSTRSHQLLLDLGCGSGLSAHALENAGYCWIGVDVAREMLVLAGHSTRNVDTNEGVSRPATCAGLVQADLGSLPFRAHAAIDGAISVSTLQWLCEGRGAGGKSAPSTSSARNDALQNLFARLHSTLRPGANAVFQFYPSDACQAWQAHKEAATAGFSSCQLLVDMPHVDMPRACKYFLCASKRPEPTETEAEAGVPSDSERHRVCPLAWPHHAACSCSAAWLPEHDRPSVFGQVIDTVGCCAASTTSSPRPAWLDRLYLSCRAHAAVRSERRGAEEGGTETDSPWQRLQRQHSAHVRRVFNGLGQQRCRRGPRDASDLEAQLFVSGTSSCACEDAAVFGVYGSEECVAPLVGALVARLPALSLSLEHARCLQASPPARGPAASPAALEGEAPTTLSSAAVTGLVLPGAAPHSACSFPSQPLASAAHAAARLAAVVKAAHAAHLVVAAALLHASPVEDSGSAGGPLTFSVDLALRARGASEAMVGMHDEAGKEPVDARLAARLTQAMLNESSPG